MSEDDENEDVDDADGSVDRSVKIVKPTASYKERAKKQTMAKNYINSFAWRNQKFVIAKMGSVHTCDFAVQIMSAIGIKTHKRADWWEKNFKKVRKMIKNKRDAVGTRIKRNFVSKWFHKN